MMKNYVRARIHWKYGERTGVYEDPVGSGTLFWLNPEQTTTGKPELTYFWWTEGNGSCDCSRSRMFGLGEFPCGGTIGVQSMEHILDEVPMDRK